MILFSPPYSDSVPVHNQSQPGTLAVEELTPFTLYTVQVEACTQFGCTRSPLVAMTTLEDSMWENEQYYIIPIINH